jgi:CubicO group peptidase (beta-lactamase class C family)
MADFIAWHGKTLSEHIKLRDEWAPKGYKFISVSIYGSVNDPVFAAVMLKRPAVVTQRDYPWLTASEWQQRFNEQAAQGFGPVVLAATGSASDPRFSAVFQPQTPIPLTRHGLTSGDIADPNTIQGMHSIARSQGAILRWCASYGENTDPRYAAIWIENTANELWNNEGLADDPVSYQARFDAETAAWCRPAFVTLNAHNSYMSLFTAGEIGPWTARHNMTPSDYQNEFNKWTGEGYFPQIVQAGGADALSARFAALFVQTEETTPKAFTAKGPVANAQIDAVMQQTMEQYPIVRHASIAIVHGKKLVYARGYTLAEPGWPVVEPITRFRLASVSKTITALAVFQLIQEGKLSLSSTSQGVLQLKTPSGSGPSDPRFNNVSIQQLLEHTSGIDTDSFDNGVDVANAFLAAGHPASLPVNQTMTDSYIAGLNLVTNPGATQAYSNCGYYLLGRVVAHLRGTSWPIDAFQNHLFNPLSITRIRGTVDLLADQANDEARYQCSTDVDNNNRFSPDLRVGQSLQSPTRPLVASGYGDSELAIAQSAGGISAAMTDLARLVAIMIDTQDNPALKRTTISNMLSAAATFQTGGPNRRAGYGLDGAQKLGVDSYYGQKGGLIANASSVFQFDDQWGFALCFANSGQNRNPGWYPDFDAVMNIAKGVSWGSSDLFPNFGMPSL